MKRIYTAEELSNDDYHGELFADYWSGSELWTAYNDCPAALMFAERKESKALEFGVASHAMLLEPDRFDAEFVRGLLKDEHPEALTSEAAMKSYLKDCGVKGYSNKRGAELMEMCLACDETLELWPVMLQNLEESSQGKTIVPAKDYDMIQQMRNVVFADQYYADAISGGFSECSLVSDEFFTTDLCMYSVKVRPDIITSNGEIWDYKTCQSSHPEAFGRDAERLGYYLKMALQHDVFEHVYGHKPRVVLLAQSKKSPYIPQAYEMEEWQLQIGREQYTYALKLMTQCKQANAYPAYGGGVVPLPAPQWVKNKYGVED